MSFRFYGPIIKLLGRNIKQHFRFGDNETTRK